MWSLYKTVGLRCSGAACHASGIKGWLRLANRLTLAVKELASQGLLAWAWISGSASIFQDSWNETWPLINIAGSIYREVDGIKGIGAGKTKLYGAYVLYLTKDSLRWPRLCETITPNSINLEGKNSGFGNTDAVFAAQHWKVLITFPEREHGF